MNGIMIVSAGNRVITNIRITLVLGGLFEFCKVQRRIKIEIVPKSEIKKMPNWNILKLCDGWVREKYVMPFLSFHKRSFSKWPIKFDDIIFILYQLKSFGEKKVKITRCAKWLERLVLLQLLLFPDYIMCNCCRNINCNNNFIRPVRNILFYTFIHECIKKTSQFMPELLF